MTHLQFRILTKRAYKHQMKGLLTMQSSIGREWFNATKPSKIMHLIPPLDKNREYRLIQALIKVREAIRGYQLEDNDQREVDEALSILKEFTNE